MGKIILFAMLILPWLSLFLLSKYSIKRFMPVAILGSLLVTIVFEIGYVYEWWKIQQKITPWDVITSVPLVYGIFLVGTIWVFHFAYERKFGIYIFINILVDGFYSFIALKVLISIGIYRLVNMGNLGIFLMMLTIAVIIYIYQKWQDGIMKIRE
ncbi:hypothetical protein JK636_00460 [Clostridium sp. YIM B02515]|uniref:Uncharacterized protein n=1 Tax=Clostridium rhizosphaerae TaxID=2803861 RepID=A0ABS1T656_9CLOT|nr:hypothetical protein [Clostridium rhizosphaerae]MBL4934222.1 hypothetical protein [Clostridium rhizosphaerae]